MYGENHGPVILDGFDHKQLEGVLNHVHTNLNMTIPLLQIVYALNRMIVITRPQLIHKYCTKKVTLLMIFSVILFAMALSSYDLYEKGFANVFSMEEMIQSSAEVKIVGYSDYLNIGLMAVIFLILLVSILVLTKRMNTGLTENIDFLKTMDTEKHRNRISSYQNVINFNKCIAIISLISSLAWLIDTCCELLTKMISLKATGKYILSFEHIHLLIVIICSLEVCIHPMVFLWFLPSIRQSWKIMAIKIRSVLLSIIRR